MASSYLPCALRATPLLDQKSASLGYSSIALIAVWDYEEYLKEIIELTKQVKTPTGAGYPSSLNTAGKRAIYDNLDKNEGLAMQVDETILFTKEHGWIGHPIKEKKVRNALRRVLNEESLTIAILEIVKLQDEYQ
ncbi:MAG: hypothetical protein LUQ38_12850 [Methanotrichaceae archaeon]|nr:hypothetical protein [Methanotrichaceae archaeon]